MKDLGGVTLLVSVRDNDLKGRSSDDLTELAEVHGNPDNQDEHCLRSRTQDEPGGSEAAVSDCRTFIRGRVAEALDGLDASGRPGPRRADRAARAPVAPRGTSTRSLPTFYVRIGQAIHAVEDSFTHTYRTADGMKITVVMNWVDKADGTYDESRDGPAHATQMDVCDDSDALSTTRRTLATEASIALLRATLDPLKTKAEKMATVDGILDTYLSYSPGLHLRERLVQRAGEPVQGRGVDVPRVLVRGWRPPGRWPAAPRPRADLPAPQDVPAPSLALLAHRRGGRLRAGAAAHAPPDAPPNTATPERVGGGEGRAPRPRPRFPYRSPGRPIRPRSAWGAYLGLSGSVDKPAVAIQLGRAPPAEHPLDDRAGRGVEPVDLHHRAHVPCGPGRSTPSGRSSSGSRWPTRTSTCGPR